MDLQGVFEFDGSHVGGSSELNFKNTRILGAGSEDLSEIGISRCTVVCRLRVAVLAIQKRGIARRNNYAHITKGLRGGLSTGENSGARRGTSQGSSSDSNIAAVTLRSQELGRFRDVIVKSSSRRVFNLPCFIEECHRQVHGRSRRNSDWEEGSGGQSRLGLDGDIRCSIAVDVQLYLLAAFETPVKAAAPRQKREKELIFIVVVVD